MGRADQNQVLRLLPIFVGVLASCLLVLNRLLTPNLMPSQARSDAVGIIISAVLVLVGLLWQQVQPRSPTAVELIGNKGLELNSELPSAIQAELAWASQLLLTNTVTRSIVVYYQGKVLLRRGILAPKAEVTPGPIVKRSWTTQNPIYLVDLKLYPGRVEFDYLPENSQGLICHPLGQDGALVLAANAPRSYTKQDEAWIAGIAEKLEDTLLSISTESSTMRPRS